MKYTEPPLTIAQQLTLLQHKNLTIEDEYNARNALESIGYFRLKHYMHYFKRDYSLVAGTSIEDIRRLYEFDKIMRIALFDAIADIEVAIKALINNSLACRYGSHWLEMEGIFKPTFTTYHQSLLADLGAYCRHNPDEQFIRRYKQTYSEPELPPSWMVMEVLSFGKISMIYDGLLNTADRIAISSYLKTHDNILTSWLHSFTYIRNLCAHHSRLLDRKLTIKPTMPARKKNRFLIDVDELDVSKVYAIFCCIQYLLQTINPGSPFKGTVCKLIAGNNVIPLQGLGFTNNWQQEDIWQ